MPTLQSAAASSFAQHGTLGVVQFCQYRSTDCTLSSGVVTASDKPEHLQPTAQCQQEAQNMCILRAGGLRIKWVGCVQHSYLGAPDCHGVPTQSANLSACTPQRDAVAVLPGSWRCTLMAGLQPKLNVDPSQANALPLVAIALGIRGRSGSCALSASWGSVELVCDSRGVRSCSAHYCTHSFDVRLLSNLAPSAWASSSWALH
jgi:hypothetical protein